MSAHGFLTPLRVELVSDTANDGRGEWKLTQELSYRCRDGSLVVVPIGFHTEFASVPRIPGAFLLTGCTAHRASVVHDYLLRLSLCARRDADDIFHEAMLASGIPKWRADMMHIAVRSYTESIKPIGQEGKGHEFA